MPIIYGFNKDAEVFIDFRVVIFDPPPDLETGFFNHFIIIIRYGLFTIDILKFYEIGRSNIVTIFQYPPTYYRNIWMLADWISKRIEVEKSKENLSGADLSDTKLIKAKLNNANLSDADLSDAYLIQANLVDADLSNADLSRAVLSQAKLKGANLRGADLTDAYLSEADLQEADLEDAELLETHLEGADLRKVKNLTCEQIEDAYIDKNTKFPDYLEISWTSDNSFTCKINS